MNEYVSFRPLFPNKDFLTIPSRSFIIENIDNIEKVYHFLSDEESKEAFSKRIYALGNNQLTFSDRCNILKKSVSTDKQYFAKNIIKINDKETFIDAGTYNGGDIIEFVKHCKGQYSNIIAFEPDPVNYKNTDENLQKHDLHNFILISKALFDKKGKVFFNAGYNFGAGISVNGKYEVDTVNLDDLMGESGVGDTSFIKMDIEGAEKEALLGARSVIKNNKPKLAISIYHKEEDIFAIPLLIKELNPDYKIYIRAHTFYFEMLCYAV